MKNLAWLVVGVVLALIAFLLGGYMFPLVLLPAGIGGALIGYNAMSLLFGKA